MLPAAVADSEAASPRADQAAFDPALGQRIERAQTAATDALLGERNAQGTWTGELSPSALSTATAITALMLVSRHDAAAAPKLRVVIARGAEWLIAHQNADGGWGDTPESISNISTTTLVWAALGLSDVARRVSGGSEIQSSLRSRAGLPDAQPCIAAAEAWLTRAAGSLEPSRLVAAIEQRYGEDRTFSIPILTMCALCGRLGDGAEAWRHVRQLPFELAALPQRWFGALQLPVVSYALPALIAIGQVRHALRPTSNPLARAIRNRCRVATLEKLGRLQPENGGFLEATPLTSFVVMSLAAAGRVAHPVTGRGVAFIVGSARADGSWPIDTNLATWVTTLSVNALSDEVCGVARRVSPSAAARDPEPCRTGGGTSLRSRAGLLDRDGIIGFLLRQQFRREHPYTLAAPGGWAWTNLPGGVPDGDDTAGAILALHQLGADDAASREAIAAGVTWLLDLQNRDGGIPTFCRGWGRLPFDRSSPDITAHAIRAWSVAQSELPATAASRVDAALLRAVKFLRETQLPDGAWIPLWFGNQRHACEENPLYGTARVLVALCELPGPLRASVVDAMDRAREWLLAHQNSDGGWSSAGESSLEESALAIEALVATWPHTGPADTSRSKLQRALQTGAAWLCAAIEHGQWRSPRPIGLYFAKLWYHERLYPLIFATGALTRLGATIRN